MRQVAERRIARKDVMVKQVLQVCLHLRVVS
jgi:hypothetical protein